MLTVRDFSMLFDAYTQFEESMIAAQMERRAAPTTAGRTPAAGFGDAPRARLERLMERRAEPRRRCSCARTCSVHEWVKRAALFEGDPAKVIGTYATAVKTVDADKAVGKPQRLWLEFARFYEKRRPAQRAGDPAEGDGRAVQERRRPGGCGPVGRDGDPPQEVRSRALRAQGGGRDPRRRRGRRRARRCRHGCTSTRLWSFYADLQENLSPFEETRQTYEKMFELRIVTPQLVLNYAAFLEEYKHFEGAFSAFEKGVALFHHRTRSRYGCST